MAPKSKDATPAPTITTHHSMAAGGQPSAAHEPPEATENTEVVLTRPKKLVLQPMHAAVPDGTAEATPAESKKAQQPDDEDAPLVLETAAETEAAASKLAAKLPEDKIELPLEEITFEAGTEDELADRQEPTQGSEDPAKKTETTPEAADPGEAVGASVEIDPNEVRSQKAEALMASGKYAVHIHESSRSRTGLIVALSAGAVVLVTVVYSAIAEGMLDVGIDLPKFW